jgi:hypothetical protein
MDNIAKDLGVDTQRVKDLLDRYQRIKMAREDAQQKDLI